MKSGIIKHQKKNTRLASANVTAGRAFQAGAGVVALAIACLSGCSRGPEAAVAKKGPRPAPVPVLVAKAVLRNIPVELHAIGNVMPYTKVTIRSQITGQLTKVHFQEGQDVRRDDLLFTLDPRPMEAAAAQARANLGKDQAQLENARVQFDREKSLLDSRLVSKEEFDNAAATLDTQKATVLADEAAITNADLSLGFTAIRSPVEGRTGSLMVFEGNIVKSPDDPMVIINQVHPIYVAFPIPEQYLQEIRRQMAARKLKVHANYVGIEGPAPEGELTFIDNTVDTTTGQIQLKGTFANENNMLWPGQFVTVSLRLSELSQVTVAPSQAIQTGQTNQFVFVVTPDQTVEMRPVTIGAEYEGQTVVSSGLRPGETVVTDGQLRLVPGAKISVKTEQQAFGGSSSSAIDPP